MHLLYDRRDFIKTSSIAGFGLLSGLSHLHNKTPANKRIGIIGLDTSHSIDFTKTFNDPGAPPELGGYRVVAAYPFGSKDIQTSASRIPGYIDEIKNYGAEVVSSVNELLKKSDVVLLETNDGRLHLQQALEVLKSGKRLFIDKPIAGSMQDAIEIFKAADKYKIPVFSCSSLRFMPNFSSAANGKIGKILGADTYSPANLEKTHPDFFWYGIHGVEVLFTLMGTGCRSVVRTHTKDYDLTAGTWKDGRIGSFRGMRNGNHSYGGTAFGTEGNLVLGPVEDNLNLLKEIIKYFETGIVPVRPEETLEIYSFMEAADESKRKGGIPVAIDYSWQKDEYKTQ